MIPVDHGFTKEHPDGAWAAAEQVSKTVPAQKDVPLSLSLHLIVTYCSACNFSKMPSVHPAINQVAGKKLKFAILVTGNSAPEIEKEFGDYGQLYKDLLADPDLDEEWHVFYPVNNQFPTDDDLQGFKVLDLLCTI